MVTGELNEGLQETLAVFETTGEAGEPLTTAEVADRIDVSRRSTYARLEKLVDRGHLGTKKVGARGRVWWRPPAQVEDADPPPTLPEELASVVYRCRNEPGWPMELVGGGCAELSGYEAEALVSGPVSWGEDLVHPDDRAHVREAVAEGLERRGKFSLTYRIRTADGETRWVWERGRGLPVGTGEPSRLEGFITDVTELKRQTAHLESEIEEVFQRVDDAFYALDEDWQFTYANESAEDFLGRPAEDLYGQTIWDAFPEAVGTELEEQFRGAMETQESVSFERYSEPLDIFAEVRAYPSETGLSVYFRDVTERRQTQQQLEEERDMFAQGPTVVFRWEPDEAAGWPVEYVSENVEDVFGYTPEELESGEVPYTDLLLDEELDRIAREVEEHSDESTARFSHDPYRVKTKDGDVRWVKDVTKIVRDEAGEITNYLGYLVDITERTERERELRRYERIVENLPVGVYRNTPGPDGEFVEMNSTLPAIFGADSEEELLDHEVSDLYPDPERRAEFSRQLEREGIVRDVELEQVTLDGETIWISVTAIRTVEDGEVYFDGIVQDVTERRERERELEESERRYRTLVENFPNGAVGLVDRNLRYVTVGGDPRTDRANMASDLEGRPVCEALSDELAAVLVPRYEAALDGESSSFEYEHADGDRYSRFRVFPVRDENGETFAALGMSQDVTEQKRRERELERYETLLTESRDVNAVLNPDGTFQFLPPSTENVLGYEPAELVGENSFEYVHPDDRERVMAEFERLVEDPGYEPRIEFRYGHADGSWIVLEAHGRNLLDDPDIEGIVAYTRDVTERRARERELEWTKERYRSLADNFPNGGVGVYDEDLRYTLVTGTMWDDIEPDAADLEGETIWDALPPETADDVEPIFRGALAGETGTVVSQLGGRTYRVWATPLRDADGVIVGGQSFALDITEQLEREQRLQESERRYRTLAEYFPNGIVTLFDHDLRYELAAGGGFEDIPVDPDDVEGFHFEEVWGEETAAALEPAFEAALEGEERSVEVAYEGREWVVRVVPITDERGDVFAGMTMAQDITGRKERERELEMFETVARTAADVIVTIDTDSVVQDVNPAVADVFGYEPEALVGEPLTTLMPDELAGDHLEAVSEYLTAGVRSLDWEYVELPGVRADGTEIPLAISFSEYEHGDERYFTGIIRDISRRKERERELVHQREQLSALNSINEVVREITEAVVEQPTREEIEETVCEHLAAAGSYEFAWIGDVDRATDSFEVRAEADAADYLEEISIRVDPDDERSRGPTATALRTGEIQTVDDVEADPDYEPWRETATRYDVGSSAAIPIVHEGTVYGVLNVYASRRNAFEGQERTVVEQLGEVVGHAIAAVDRKRALMSDEVVELQFRIPDVFDAIGVDAAETGRITLDQVVPVADDEFLVYGSATADAVDDLSAIVDAVPHWDDVTFHDEDGDTTFELRLTEPPVLTTLASLGGSVEAVVIEEGDYDMTLQLSPSADSRRLIEAVQEAYPVAEMMTRRQVTRTDETAEGIDRALAEHLTDRQLTALRAAYHAGFYEWPRDTSGEDLAASLDVSAPTFHQHLRKAEKKVFDELLGEISASSAQADD